MKAITPALVLALALSMGAAGWLFLENRELRAALLPVSKDHALPSHGVATPHPSVTSETAGAPKPKRPSSASPTAAAGNKPPQAPGELAVAGNGDGSVTVTDPTTGVQTTLPLADLNRLSQEAMAAVREQASRRPGGPSWSPGQAAGAPDTPQHGDFTTAWAPQAPDGGPEWLLVKYDRPVEVREINIHESYNPGALSKVSAIMPDGSERVIWEGSETPEQGYIERSLPVPPGVRADQIRVELDTTRVPGWNEIDAVELVGTDGTRQWGRESTASSYYGQSRPVRAAVEALTVEPGTVTELQK